MMDNRITYTFRTKKDYSKFRTYLDNDSLELKIRPNNIIQVYYFDDYSNHIQINVEDLIELHDFLTKKNISGSIDNEDIRDCQTILLENNYIDILDYLIENNFVTDRHFGVMLIHACTLSNTDTISYLLKYCDDIDHFDKYCALDAACRRGGVEIVAFLLEKINYTQTNLNGVLCSTVKGNSLNTLKLLIENGADIHSNNELLCVSMEKNSIDIMEYLLSNGADITTLTDEQIEYSIEKNHVERIELLLNRLNRDQKWIDNIFKRSAKYSVEMVQLLVDNGANVKKYRKQVCEAAKRENNNHLVEYLKKLND
jgi:Ankyrin repeats (3 copies)